MKVEKLRDFNRIIQAYKIVLSYAKRINFKTDNFKSCYRMIINDLNAYDTRDVEFGIMLANYCALFISQVHERTKGAADDLLDEYFDNASCMNSIACKKEGMSLKDKKREIRNALAHANFDIVVETQDENGNDKTPTFDDIYISIDNNNIRGKISLTDMDDIAKNYKHIFYQMHIGPVDRILVKPFNLDSNISSFDQVLDQIRVIKITKRKDDEGIPYDKFRYRVTKELKKLYGTTDSQFESHLDSLKGQYRSFDLEIESLGDKEKEFLKKYHKYFGEKYFTNNMGRIFNDMMYAWNEGIISIEILENVLKTFNAGLSVIKSVIKENGDKLNDTDISIIRIFSNSVVDCSFQSPIIYTNNLLAMAYYELNYAREVNDKSDGMYFNYYNIRNLNGITATITDKDGNKKTVPIEENSIDKLKHSLKNVDEEFAKLRKDKNVREKRKRSLENPRNQNPQKEQMLNEIEEWMENEYNPREQALNAKRNELSTKISEEEQNGSTNKSSFEFFRHLRNSLAHGNYTITYGDFSNLDSVRYKFNDIADDGVSTYSVELTASQLEKILDGFQRKVNECDKGYIDQKVTERDVVKQAIAVIRVGEKELKAFNVMADIPHIKILPVSKEDITKDIEDDVEDK